MQAWLFQVSPSAWVAGLLGLRVMSKGSLMAASWFRDDPSWTFQSCIQPSLLRALCILTGLVGWCVCGGDSATLQGWLGGNSVSASLMGKPSMWQDSDWLDTGFLRMRKSFFSSWKEEKPQVYLIFSRQLIFIAFLISSLALPWPFSLASHAWCLITYH